MLYKLSCDDEGQAASDSLEQQNMSALNKKIRSCPKSQFSLKMIYT